ncbi:MAG: ribosomal large subunit methyltransferase [Chlamydiales bacterium]|jgi:23S rRNA G2069 N7-methylase RlmK/C1962 C5-methylase RlmI|nr:ribosomal large subunit methyltransferase [Chlamydiales bacterium]
MNETIDSLPLILDDADKASPFKNCIRKNYRHLRKWAQRTDTNCFRIYDRDIKAYPLAIDYYAGRFCVHYFSSLRESAEPSAELQKEIEGILFSLFGCAPSLIYWRSRIRRTKVQQYEKAGNAKEFFIVREYGVQFRVNLVDYLDTGLFLDHRETRRLVASLSPGKRLLNLFAYTSAFSVHAACSQAASTKSVDMSNTYTAWSRENFKVNGISLANHSVVREDCLKFLDQEILLKNRYDLIVIDPPTISRSKKMEQMFDIQQDYVSLLSKALKLLAKGGEIFFSTNSRKFVLDASLFPHVQIKEITDKTRPIDFRDLKIHRCWRFSSN